MLAVCMCRGLETRELRVCLGRSQGVKLRFFLCRLFNILQFLMLVLHSGHVSHVSTPTGRASCRRALAEAAVLHKAEVAEHELLGAYGKGGSSPNDAFEELKVGGWATVMGVHFPFV